MSGSQIDGRSADRHGVGTDRARRCRGVPVLGALAVACLVAACGTSTVSVGAGTTEGTGAADTSVVSVLPSGPARDYAPYLVHHDVAIAGPRGTLSPLTDAQLEVVIKAPDPLWISGANTPTGTAVERARDFGDDQILLGSYSSPFPRTGTSVEYVDHIVWILVGHSACVPDVAAPKHARPQRTSWTIVDARTGEIGAMQSLSDTDCQPIGGP